jgi:hypothetical protein
VSGSSLQSSYSLDMFNIYIPLLIRDSEFPAEGVNHHIALVLHFIEEGLPDEF